MEDFLDKLILSAEHLKVIDDSLQSYPPYSQESQKLKNINFFTEILKEIYVGGKKRSWGRRSGYDRQMILGDLLQYIFTGRGYYFAVRGKDEFESFIRILLRISNLLILMEDISVETNLRRTILANLENTIGDNLFETPEDREKFQRLLQYDGKIVGNAGNSYEEAFDSILPKRVGGVPELLVYTYLIRKNYGYVVPLLQAQRLLGKREYIVPPDFLLLRSKGEAFGLEVGAGKESQISSFSTVTSMPVFTVGIGSLWQPQPFRCGKCQKWITYCDEVIEQCATNRDGNKKKLDCANCEKFDNGNCEGIVYHGRARDYAGNEKDLRYHYECVRNDPVVINVLRRARTPKLIAPFPWVSGLENIKEE